MSRPEPQLAVICFTDASGVTQRIEALADGRSIMQTLQDAGVDWGVCGGECACGSCVALVHSDWRSQLPEPQDQETPWLSLYPPGARLSCQLAFTPEFDGIVLEAC